MKGILWGLVWDGRSVCGHSSDGPSDWATHSAESAGLDKTIKKGNTALIPILSADGATLIAACARAYYRSIATPESSSRAHTPLRKAASFTLPNRCSPNMAPASRAGSAIRSWGHMAW